HDDAGLRRTLQRERFAHALMLCGADRLVQLGLGVLELPALQGLGLRRAIEHPVLLAPPQHQRRDATVEALEALEVAIFLDRAAIQLRELRFAAEQARLDRVELRA